MAKEQPSVFRVAVNAMIERGEIPTADKVAEAVGSLPQDAQDWIDDFCKGSIAATEARYAVLAEEATTANMVCRAAADAVRQAEKALSFDRSRKGEPLPDLDDPQLRGDDPLINAVITARAHLEECDAALDEPQQRKRYARYGIEDRKVDLAKVVEKLRVQMAALDKMRDQRRAARVRLDQARKDEDKAYESVILQHVEHWRLSGRLPDYIIDEEPQTAAAGSRR